MADASDRFSSGIPDLDRQLDGGFRRGSFALYNVGDGVTTADLHLLFRPTWLNFLRQSRGIMIVLPSRESPASFRDALLPFTTRRLFDSRVRVVEYVGQDEEAPYTVNLRVGRDPAKDEPARRKAMADMVEAEKAVQGARGKPFLECTALEVLETLAGTETAGRMYFHGMKRTKEVGNLGIALARPGLNVTPVVRGLVDYEFSLDRTSAGLTLAGTRPAFTAHRVLPDPRLGIPHVELATIGNGVALR